MRNYESQEQVFLRINSVTKSFGKQLSRDGFERPYLLAKELLSYALLDDGGTSGTDVYEYLKKGTWAEYDTLRNNPAYIYKDFCLSVKQTVAQLLNKKYFIAIDDDGIPACGTKYLKYIKKCKDWDSVRNLLDEESMLDSSIQAKKQEILDSLTKKLDEAFDEMILNLRR